MIFTALERIVAYRLHVPKWASAPTSGAGAATHGGRANRIGTQALYLALDMQTALLEYQQLSSLMPPGTLVTYIITAAPVVDFRAGYSPSQWSALWDDFYCDWRALWFDRRIEPPSWALSDEVLAAGAKGILFPSRLAPGGVNLVLHPNMLSAGDTLAVHDPAGALPKNQDSWR